MIDLGCGQAHRPFTWPSPTSGSIVAVDRHEPNIERLRAKLAEHGLDQRVTAMVADITRPLPRSGSYDLVWSEGALYSVGLDRALGISHGLLRPRGYVAFTDAIWRTDDPPAAVRAVFESDYPTMGRVPDVLALIPRHGFDLVDHFPLPDAAWWDDFYTPMLLRIEEMRARYADDEEALRALDELACEPAMHREHGAHYTYEFFVARRR